MYCDQLPFIIFDFSDYGNRQIFAKPVKVISVDQVDEVIAALHEVERAVNSGCYAAGFLSYEAAPAFDSAFKVSSSHSLPLLWFGIFDSPSVSPALHEDEQFSFTSWTPTVERDRYSDALHTIKDAISRGETYQVNYTMRLHSNFSGDDLTAYHRLRDAQHAGYSAYLNIGRYRILSFSPELFFSVHGQHIVTRPMKGTVKRGRWAEEDEARASWLRSSGKNQAENVMIVDLLRNDVSRIAKLGSVYVPKLFEIEKYPTVHQMTSTVSASLRPEISLTEVFAALFPCGSITGAPKISTMGLIAELEGDPRDIYCGAIGFIKPHGEAVFNVAIRTIFIDSDTGVATYGTGGGITWDSVDHEEYGEALTKADFLTVDCPVFELLETIKFDGERYVLLEQHLERLARSARYFGIKCDIGKIEQSLKEHIKLCRRELRRVRLLVSQQGEIHVESSTLDLFSEDLFPVFLAKEPISKGNRFLYHKTTYRSIYELHRAQNPKAFDVLLWNEDGAITEFTNGNIVVEIEGRKFTPPIECGLLPGTFREKLLNDGLIKEKVLTRTDLEHATHMWFINSVRGWVPVYLLSLDNKSVN